MIFMQCPTRISVRDPNNSEGYNVVPCGRCPICKLIRVQGWTFRLLQELKVSWAAEFATLTYAPQFLPTALKDGRPTLRPMDLTHFFARLRKNTKRKGIKYYVVGEYGGRFNRPHYHLIIFNVTREEIEQAWSLKGVLIGHVNYGDKPGKLFAPKVSNVNSDSIAYCCKYINKPGKINRRDFKSGKESRVPEFSRMSKGLGANYLTPQMIKYHRDGLFSFVMDGQFPQQMPRYYRDKIFDAEQREIMNNRVQIEQRRKLEYDWYLRGYDKSLALDHPHNQKVLTEYYRCNAEAINAAWRSMAGENKRDKVD